MLARGFQRWRCESCGGARLVAFSRAGRGLSPQLRGPAHGRARRGCRGSRAAARADGGGVAGERRGPGLGLGLGLRFRVGRRVRLRLIVAALLFVGIVIVAGLVVRIVLDVGFGVGVVLGALETVADAMGPRGLRIIPARGGAASRPRQVGEGRL